MFVLKLSGQPCAPTYAAVSARHIRNRRASRRGFEPCGLGDHISDLITAPTVSLNAYGIFIDEAFINYCLNAWQNTLQSALTGMSNRINDVRHKDHIAVA